MNFDHYSQWLQILDHLNIGALLIDSNLRIQKFNSNARILIGLETEEIKGGDCQEIFCGIPCFSHCPFEEKYQTDIRDMDIEFFDEFKEKHRVTRVAAPLYDTLGRVVACITLLQDHAPYSELVNRIHYEEQSLKIILNSLNMGIFTVNRNGLITFFNKAAEKTTGFSRMNLLGRDCQTLFSKDSRRESTILKTAMKQGNPVTGITGHIKSYQGEAIPVSADYIPLLNNQGRIIGGLAAFQDLTLVHQLDKAISGKYNYRHMVGKAPVMQKIVDMVKVVAKTDSTLLIEGITGTGKDLLAKIIHHESRRSDKPFVKFNCAAIPENLLESEIFGYVKGAFTGADRDKPGRFSEAHTGTIFLDEIGDLPLSLQAKLLRVLEDREFYPLGSRKTTKVDVRILSATNRNLEELVEKKLFRPDLFYRLNVLRINLPPLSQRQGDLPLLISHILRKQAAIQKKRPPEISEEAMKVLLNYGYPGNVRELENIIEHAMIICQGDSIQQEHLPDYILKNSYEIPIKNGNGHPEKNRILDCLEKNNWHKGKTARSLNIDRTTLWRKLKKYQLS